MPNRIRELRQARRLSLDHIAQVAGTSRQQVSALERGVRRLTDDWMRRIAPALHVTPSELIDAPPAPKPPKVPGLVTNDAQPMDEFDLSTATVTKGSHRLPSGSIPLYGSAQGGAEGSMVIDNSPIGSVLRPNAVAQARDAYAVYVVGGSMAPRYENGDIATVNPHKPVSAGDDVLLVRQDSDGTRYALLKRLISFSDKVWRVRQYDPPKDFQLARDTWTLAQCVVARENGK